MKFLIVLLIALPTLLAILLFTVADFAYNNPVIAILCIVLGVIAVIPFLAEIIIGLTNLITSTEKKKEQDGKD